MLWSAAIPFQGGSGHVNEQYPAYWFEKFSKRGYVCFDVIREQIWDSPDVAWYYAQNIPLYVERSVADRLASKLKRDPLTTQSPRALVHQHRYEILAKTVAYAENISPRKLLSASLRSFTRRLRDVTKR